MDGALEVGLGTSAAGGYYLVGNPFMSHLDVAEFLTVNSDVLERKYWYVENGAQDAAVAAAQGDQGWISVAEGASGTALVPPMRSFFVKKAENAAGHTVKFTAGMQAFAPEAAGGNVNANLLRLTATTEDGRESRRLCFKRRCRTLPRFQLGRCAFRLHCGRHAGPECQRDPGYETDTVGRARCGGRGGGLALRGY